MTIQRQYSLPNCKLILEGLGEEVAAVGNPATGRPMLSVLMNAECHFVGHPAPLSGGRDFLEHLIAAVSGYAQECLSGIPHAEAHPSRHGTVRLQKVDANQHRLTVYSKAEGGTAPEPQQIDLKTLQFFDLVEAVDQLLADPQTLPDLALRLEPVSKRYATTHEPIAKRVVPAAVGVSGLAIAATALFFMPIPEVRPPEPRPTTEESSGTSSPAPEGSTAASPVPTSTPAAGGDRPTADEDAASSTADESSDEANAEVLAAAASTSLEDVVAASPMIAELTTLEQLNDDLRDTLSEAWDRDGADFPEDLEYRVVVAEDGSIVAYRHRNEVALEYVDQTPLRELLYLPVGDAQDQPLAEFKVVFRPEGVIEVSPWHGWPTDNAE